MGSDIAPFGRDIAGIPVAYRRIKISTRATTKNTNRRMKISNLTNSHGIKLPFGNYDLFCILGNCMPAKQTPASTCGVVWCYDEYQLEQKWLLQ